MLVLSRHRGQKIIIGDDIIITVTRIDGDKVRLGIEAPREMLVHRQEVTEKPDYVPRKVHPRGAGGEARGS